MPSGQPTGVVIGAGDRGANAYVPLLLDEPELGRIVGVAERNPKRRLQFADRYGLNANACFIDASELFEQPRLADFALIATQDDHHVEPALRALESGYHVLLEKPMALNIEDCERLAETSARTGRLLQICHVLRYARLYRSIKEVIDSGEIGDLVTIQHSENVSFWHYAHSYCRGNWRNRAASSPMVLAKSCHDLDLLHWLADSQPIRLTSIESPTRLCAENAPTDAPEFCIAGCPHSATCPYDAASMYRDLTPLLLDIQKKTNHSAENEPAREPPAASGWKNWPVSAITDDLTREGIDRALRESRYGRCVYRIGDNDQPASQSISIQFANGVNANFTMHSTSHREGRETRIDGTRGTLVAGFYNLEQHAIVHDHKSGRQRVLPVDSTSGRHGGADPALFRVFLAAVRGEKTPETTVHESIWSHRLAFAADRSAREGRVMDWSA